MSDTNGRFKRAKSTKKTAPVTRVTLSAEARQAYEKLMKEKDEKAKSYTRHLAADNRPR